MITVFLIACPCAVGLAVPMAVMLSTAEASKVGLLISGGDVIEKGSKIDVVVFDKTGTLTVGKPEVIEAISAEGKETEFLFAAGSLAQFSSHPLSKAITLFIQYKKINIGDPDKFKNNAGFGVEAVIENKRILMGSRDYLIKDNINVPLIEQVGSYV